jgi:replicative DNA helicase
MDFTNLTPPNNQIAEKQVLSSMLLNQETLFNLIADLSPDHFYNADHRRIFAAIREFKTSDISVLAMHIEDQPDTLFEILEIGAFRDCSESVSQLKGMLSRREGIKASLRAAMALQNDFESTPDEIINQNQSQLSKITMGNNHFQPEHIAAILPRVFSKMEEQYKRRESGNTSLIIDTGISDIDARLFIDDSDLVVIGARPSMGKSAFVSQMIRHNARKGKSCLFFSVEMSKEIEAKRELFSESQVNMHMHNLGILPKRELPKLSMGCYPLAEMNIWIDSEPGITPSKVRSKCNYVKAQSGLDLIVLDYLQITKSDERHNSTRESIGYITREYKAIAKLFNVPFVLLSQLGRSVEQRQDKRPLMSDLMESGDIEAAADTILFLHRDHYYTRKEEDSNKCEVICAKQRNGEAGWLKQIFFEGSIGKFANLEQQEGEF